MSTSIWIKPSGVEIKVDSGSDEAAEELGWVRKTKAPTTQDYSVPIVRKGRPPLVRA
jgi:hypothetical protein